MVAVSIIINRVNELKPSLPEIKVMEAQLTNIVIMEKGTAAGKTALLLYGKLPSGEYVLIQTTATLFQMAYSALQGAEQRFKDFPVQDLTPREGN